MSIHDIAKIQNSDHGSAGKKASKVRLRMISLAFGQILYSYVADNGRHL